MASTTTTPLTAEQERFIASAMRRHNLTRRDVLDAGYRAYDTQARTVGRLTWEAACRYAGVVKRGRDAFARLDAAYLCHKADCEATHGEIAAASCRASCLRSHPHECTCHLDSAEWWAMMAWRSPVCELCGGLERCLPTCEAMDAIRSGR